MKRENSKMEEEKKEERKQGNKYIGCWKKNIRHKEKKRQIGNTKKDG